MPIRRNPAITMKEPPVPAAGITLSGTGFRELPTMPSRPLVPVRIERPPPMSNIRTPPLTALSAERAGVAACRLSDMLGIQARRTPDRIAVASNDRTMRYGELWARVTALARVLRERGTSPGDYVGIATDRSLDLPVALWGVVHSGAAYVPLDPSYPQARLDHMVASARLPLVVTTRRHAARFRNVELVVVEDVAAEAEQCEASATPHDPLYAIFTSGSTGQPKAATVFRRGFANLLDWYVREFGIKESDRTLVITSPSFDLTQKNLFAPLVTGGLLVLDDCERYDLARIGGLIRDHGVTLVNCTPSAFQPLVDATAAAGHAGLSSLRLAVLGGEPIHLPRLRPWLTHPECHAEVANTYGPTECTDICAFHRLTRGNLDDHPFVPLGREIDHVQVAILDQKLQPVNPGETGELCIGGTGVGGGYLHDPERTARSFVDNPVPNLLQGGKIYRTGDLVRRLPDGLLEFRGRADHQVKIRGFRVELGEIESVLAAHPQVRAAVVIPLELQPGEIQLSASVESADSKQPPSIPDLRAHLASRIPAHMLPAQIHVLPAFPLTPNGKVDRMTLAALTRERQSQPCAPPNVNSVERRIMGVWSEVLGKPVTDPAANFFDLGASSIHLAVAHVRLLESFAKDFPITELFAHTTARALAQFLSPQPPDRGAATQAKERARLQQQALARLRRPLPR